MQTKCDRPSGGDSAAGVDIEGTDKKISGGNDDVKREEVIADVNKLLDELIEGEGDKVLLLAFMNSQGQTKGMIWNSGKMLDLQAVGDMLKKVFSQETFAEEGSLN